MFSRAHLGGIAFFLVVVGLWMVPYEQEWLANLPSRMMQHTSEVSPASPRKLRLLAVAYARFLESKPEYADAKHVTHLGEEVVEGYHTLDELWDDRVRGVGVRRRLEHC